MENQIACKVTVDLKQLEKRVDDYLEKIMAPDGVVIAFGAIGGIAEQTGQLQTNIRKFLAIVGTADLCKACGKEIWWVVNPKTNKRMPITADAISHFADCPEANKFKKAK
jgi:hypothetical protein